MNFFDKISKKLRYGSTSLGIIAIVIIAVLMLNIGATALFTNNLIFMDMTPESYYSYYQGDTMIKKSSTMYSLMDETKYLLDLSFEELSQKRGEDEPVKVDIIFCNDPDRLIASDSMRYVYYTALMLEKEYPEYIDVKTTNVWTNPSSVDAYRSNSYSQIYQSNVIVASGGEFRIATARSYYVFSEVSSDTPWAYHGEKIFVSQILAVTQAESPICCLTTNHGEPIRNDEYSEFRKLIESVGYEVRYLNLETEEIPENCRLIITLDPQSDFKADYRNPDAVTEITKLQSFLNNAYSFMVFADADTPELPVFEEYLEDWGISFVRYGEEGNYVLSDPNDSLDSNSAGTNLIGQYELTAPSAVWTEDMRSYGANPKVIFGNAMGIEYSSKYQFTYQPADDEAGNEEYTYGLYSGNGSSRTIYDLFHSGKNATAYATKNGERLTDASGNPIVYSNAPFRLMTITNQDNHISEGAGYTVATESAYVCAVGSVRFASNEMLTSDVYGNTDALLSVLRSLGHEVSPVGLNFKVLHTDGMNMEIVSADSVTAWTIVLIAIPVVAMSFAGIFVLVRRKTRH